MKYEVCNIMYNKVNFENKKVIVALGAKFGGAKTILEMYYNRALDDNNNDYIFILSSNLVESNRNIEVIVIPLGTGIIAKIQGFRKIYLSNLSKRLRKAKEITSLDNCIYGFKNTKNIVYLHQALPYEYMYGKRYLTLLQTLKMFIIKINMQVAVIASDEVVVQTNHFKDKIVKSFSFLYYNPSCKIKVEYPTLSSCIIGQETLKMPSKYIYPTNAMKYKNIEVLIASFESIRNYGNLEFLITLNGDENSYIKNIKKTVLNNGYPIKFVGKLENEEILSLYSKGYGLFFSSKIESFGLPILEAINSKTWILAYESPTTKEILYKFEYEKFDFFKNDTELSKILNNVAM